ncbi:MAG TPA: hypothetical protein VFP35_02065 [Candidatus Saccharimonadales bacterium]|nr:hypothetical protein [Candidatus Saccharimonadales bacterium]
MVAIVRRGRGWRVRVTRPRGHKDLPPRVLGLMLLHFEHSELCPKGQEYRPGRTLDETGRRFILVDGPLDDSFCTDECQRSLASSHASDIVGRCFEVAASEEAITDKVDAGAGEPEPAKHSRRQRLPARVYAPARAA